MHRSRGRFPSVLLLALFFLPLHATPGSAKEGALDAGAAMRLASSWSLSPDGADLYLSWRGDLWRVPAKGGTAIRLTTHPADDRYPCVSPDGRQLAFVSNREGPGHVYVMDIRGGAARRVTTYTGGFNLYGWFPDGRSLLVRTRQDHHWRQADRFFRRTLDPLDPLELLFDAYGGSPAISPDGSAIAFVREGVAWWRKGYHGAAAGQIWRYDMTSHAFAQLTKGEHGERWPQWSADGKHIFFCSQEKGRSFNLWRMAPDGTERRQLTRFEDDSVVFPRIAANGGSLVFRRLFDLYRYDLRSGAAPVALTIRAGGEPTMDPIERVTLSRATNVAFTDDAREIAFVAGGDVWVMDTELRDPRRVTNTPAEERDPVFSPDFQTLSFVSDAAGQPDIFQARRGDDESFWWQNEDFVIKRITNDAETEEALQVVPGGERLSFVHGNGTLTTMKLDGTDRQVLVEHWDAPDYDFSPDGKWVTWSAADNDFNNDVWIMPVDKSRAAFNLSRHPDDDYDPRWSRDGKVLAWVGRREREETDVYYVWLAQTDDQLDGRDRTLEKALKKMKGRKQPAAPPADPKRAAPEQAPSAPGPDSEDPLVGIWSGTLLGEPPLPPDGLTVTLDVRRTEQGLLARLEVPGQFQLDDVPLTLTENGSTLSFEAITPLGPLSATGTLEGDRLKGTWKIEGVLEGQMTLTRQAAAESAPAPAEPTKGSAGKPTPAGPEPKPTKGAKAPTLPKVQIDFDRLAERVHHIKIPNSNESALLWSPDGKRLAMRASVGGKVGTYTVGFPDSLKPKLLTTASGTHARWLAEGKQIVWLVGGTPASLNAAGKPTSYGFSVRQEVDRAARRGAAFDMAWRTMRDTYYDPALGNRDWDAVRAKYLPMAESSMTGAELETLVNMMLGELNGSHLGFRSLERPWRAAGWRDETGHLGCLFDRTYEGPGLRIARVVPDTPAAQARSLLRVGETIRSIDGRPVEMVTNLGRILTGNPKRDVELRVADEQGEERVVRLRPISYAAVRARLYDLWQADERERVDELSKGTLGYLHVRGMNWASFEKFEAELYKVGHGKDGLIIDVRENGGGFTTDHLLTTLTQPTHAITVPRGGGRGYPQGRMVYAHWNKPIVVLCNQNSFSNAEIFSHAIQQLKRGPIVGVQTAGGVISTGGTLIMGLGSLRLPFRGWFLAKTGEDMELNGCLPEYVLWPKPGELPAGIDRQLDKAVEVLQADVVRWKARPQPRLRKASERAR